MKAKYKRKDFEIVEEGGRAYIVRKADGKKGLPLQSKELAEFALRKILKHRLPLE
ncbi:hypothetical protein KSU1_C1494 [Candidatus Jettenia caeni]|uniref:Uncharacterized protein n=1 Tax=Candidatus Jettenia caeni TaxID=247490 RepID=I3IMZ5_9BACT|nr:hypothetical protein [Candidatus Jettenia sp. AMX1]GAB63090.1 hypothetical protein KSU1_C1494 [Candidatus Jettenia caeni]GJQ44272.1 MAG: hypothetical protein JETCAE04_00260 [Candidatus Jettenia caeni]